MTIRRAIEADVQAVARVRKRSWQDAYAHVYPPAKLARMPLDLPRWHEIVVTPPAGWTTFVAEHDDGVVSGFACVGPSRDEGGIGELYAIYVDPPEFSTGVGRALMAGAEEHLASSYSTATLWVLEDNPRARRFYEIAGWRPDGARRSEPRWGVDAPTVRYRKRLARGQTRV